MVRTCDFDIEIKNLSLTPQGNNTSTMNLLLGIEIR